MYYIYFLQKEIRMETTNTSPTKEFEAIQSIHEALEPLDTEAQHRVLKYISSLFKLRTETFETNENQANPKSSNDQGIDEGSFETLADLYDAAAPVTNADKALVVGMWVQEHLRQESFSSQTINTELKHLGHGIANITSAIDQLKEAKPSLMQQLRKSGASQQSRKTYKITLAGLRAVKAMIENTRSAR